MTPILFWHRRDLRLDDLPGLFSACASGPVESVFVFDSTILSTLPSHDRRVDFIWRSVSELATRYAQLGLKFHILHGDPVTLIPALASRLGALRVIAHRDYEPSSNDRDSQIHQALLSKGAALELHQDHVIFEAQDIRTQQGGAYSVFTPYKNAWLNRFAQKPPGFFPSLSAARKLQCSPIAPTPLPSLSELGFESTDLDGLGVSSGLSGAALAWSQFQSQLPLYATRRDFPALPGTSRLGPHFRFGTASIRALARETYSKLSTLGDGGSIWLSELAWRDFYFSLLSQHPRLAHGKSFLPAFDSLTWGNDPVLFSAWTSGLTGFPIIDAAMRELSATGYMHNRCRMIAASFLVKDLDCDWRLGEAHFAKHLLDFELASNNGGWQWSASTGSDAQPYFRIFNPALQSAKFDPQGIYIKRWVPELASCPTKWIHEPHKAPPSLLAPHGIVIGKTYPAPIVSHATARMQALLKYKAIASV